MIRRWLYMSGLAESRFGRRTGARLAAALLLLMVYLVSSVLLVRPPWLVSTAELYFVLLSIPFAHNALVSAWAVTGQSKPYWRCCVALAAMVVAWAVTMQLSGHRLGGPGASEWAIGFATESLFVAAAILGTRLLNTKLPGRRLRFGVAAIMGWITFAAATFALYRVGLHHGAWDVAPQTKPLQLIALVSFEAGIMTVIVMMCFTVNRSVAVRIQAGLAGFFALGLSMPWLFWTLMKNDYFTVQVNLLFLSSLSVILCATLCFWQFFFRQSTRC